MQKHLEALDALRTEMVRKRYPAPLINRISRIILQGNRDEKKTVQWTVNAFRKRMEEKEEAEKRRHQARLDLIPLKYRSRIKILQIAPENARKYLQYLQNAK